MILATFASDGPAFCSGLPTRRYDIDELEAAFAGPFEVVHTEREVHRTPWGAAQPFTWAVFRRRITGAP